MTKGQFGSRLHPTRTRPVSDFRMRGSKWASMAQAWRASLKALREGNSCRRWRGGIVVETKTGWGVCWVDLNSGYLMLGQLKGTSTQVPLFVIEKHAN